MPKYPYRILGTFFDRVFRNNLNDNFKDVEADIKTQKNRVDTLINETEQPSEVVDARTDKDGNVYTVLKGRLDSEQQSNETQFTDTGLRIDDLEAELADNSVIQTIQYGLNVIASDRNTPLFMRKLIGKTVVNHVPLFDSGLWQNNGFTQESPTKITITADGTSNKSGIVKFALKGNTTYTLSWEGSHGFSNVHIDIIEYDSSGTLIVDGANNNDGLLTFTTDVNTVEVSLRCIVASTVTSGTYTFENIMLNEGSTAQEFVSNIRGNKNPVLFSYGKNLHDLKNNNNLIGNSSITLVKEEGKLCWKIDDLGVTKLIEGIFIQDQQYTVTITEKNDSGNGRMRIVYTDGTSDDLFTNTVGSFNTTSVTSTSGKSIDFIEWVYSSRPHLSYISVEDFQIELGSTATSFEEYNASYQVIKGTFYDNDELTWNENGEPVKLADKKEVVLDGSLDWEFYSDDVGVKGVEITGFPIDRNENIKPVISKYNGKILSYGSWRDGDSIGSGSWDKSGATEGLLISIFDTDSGWGEDTSAWTTTMWDYMIPAYFNGWKYIGSDTWESMYDSTLTTTDTNEIQSRNLHEENGKEGYRLIYELAEKETETLGYEGSLQLHEGDNQVELTEGLIVREVANPTQSSNDGKYHINIKDGTYGSIPSGNQLKYRSKKIINVFKNESKDNSWVVLSGTDAYGNERVQIEEADFDPKATYTVTYFALPYQLTSETNQVDVEYAQNLNSTVNQLVNGTTDNEHKISVLSEQKANKHQEGWIEPILMNGWSNTSSPIKFYKDDMGRVHFQGECQLGDTTDRIALFYLPKGYRIGTNFEVVDVQARNSTNSPVNAYLVILNSGSVELINPDSTSIEKISMAGLSFRAEQ